MSKERTLIVRMGVDDYQTIADDAAAVGMTKSAMVRAVLCKKDHYLIARLFDLQERREQDVNRVNSSDGSGSKQTGAVPDNAG